MNILLGESSWHPTWFMCFKKSICFISLGWTLKYKFMCKKYYGSGPISAKKLHPLLSCQPFPMMRAKARELRVMASAWRNLLNLGIETMTSSITAPFQTATMAPNLCTETRSLEHQYSLDLSLCDSFTARKKNLKPSHTTPSSLLLICITSSEMPLPPAHTS